MKAPKYIQFSRCLLFIALALPGLAPAQLLNIQGPTVDTLPCTQNCKQVTANYLQPLKTNLYTAAASNYNPVSLSAPTSLNLSDDKFSNAVSIGFPFCFYEGTYTQVYISANGHITFNSSYAGGNCSFDTRQAMPYFSASYPDNGIFCPFSDGNTSVGGTIQYQTTGAAPFRKFVVQYSNIPFFGSACSGSPATFQCVLSESTNEIEFFITNKSTCNSDTSNYLNYATLGIQSTAAQNFLVVNNRNASVWTASNEGWKISPAGALAYSLRWFVNGVNVANNVANINVCAPFTKTVVAELKLDCPNKTLTDTVVIYQKTGTIDSIVTTNTNCLNTATGTATIYASGGTAPYQYAVDGSGFGPSNFFTNLALGLHFAQVQDANGCIFGLSFYIGVDSDLGVSIDSLFDPTCPINNGRIYSNASGGVPPYTYNWSTSQTTSAITNLAPGTYSLTVTDAQGCQTSLTQQLNWDPNSLPTVTDSIFKPVCGNSTGSITLSASGTTAPYSYVWTSPSSTDSFISNLSSGIYSATVTDANGCSITFGTLLNDTLNMQLQMINFAHTTCGLNNGMGHGIATNGLPPFTYSWSNLANTPQTNTLPSGWNYLTITDANNCTRIDSLNINSSVPLSIQFSIADAYCDEDNGRINTFAAGQTGTVNYAWSNGDSTSNIDSLAAGLYVLNAIDSVGCTFTDSVNLINVGKPKLIVVQYTPPLCNGDSTGRLELSGTNGVPPYKYSFDGINFSTVAVQTNFSAGTYTIYMRDANSCESDTTIFFTPPDPIDITTSFIDTLICYQDISGPISFVGADGTAPYRWSTSESNYLAQNTFSDFGIGPHTIFVIDSNGCKNNLVFEIPGPTAPLSIESQITDVPCYQSGIGEIQVDAQGGWGDYLYSWQHTSSMDVSLYNLNPAIYYSSVVDARGCQVDSILPLQQLYCCDCYFPNAFTPNGDDNNDRFRAISPATDIKDYHLSIYNRWGARVFVTNEINGAWDGTLQGEPAPTGTYFYKCKMKCVNSKDDVFLTGDIILIR